MSNLNGSLEKVNDNSINYKLARELGYELSKQDYADMLKYAKLVQNEYSKVLETSPRPKKQARPLDRPSSSDINLLNCNIKRHVYPEDLWIKHLREYFESEKNG